MKKRPTRRHPRPSVRAQRGKRCGCLLISYEEARLLSPLVTFTTAPQNLPND